MSSCGRTVSRPPTARRCQQLIEAKRPGEPLAIEAHDAAGTARTAQLPVTESPRLISAADQGLLFNPIALALRSRLAGAAAKDQPFLRLNLAVALMRLGDYAGAREQLDAVQLPAGQGISLGTTQVLAWPGVQRGGRRGVGPALVSVGGGEWRVADRGRSFDKKPRRA